MKRLIAISLFILLLLVGCKRDDITTPFVPEDGKVVSVKIDISVGQQNIPQGGVFVKGLSDGFNVVTGDEDNSVITKSDPLRKVGSVDLCNLWVFQFKSTGEIVFISKRPDVPEPTRDLVSIDVDLVVGTNQTVYLVALGKNINDDLSHIKTKAELENYSINYLEKKDGAYVSKVTLDKDMPFAGFVEGVEVFQFEKGGQGLIKYDPVIGFGGGIKIKPLLAKVSLHYTFDVEGMSLMSLNLQNVSSYMYVTHNKSEKSSFKGFAAVDINSIIEKDEHGRTVYNWYVAANMQGEVPFISSENQRFDANAPKNATFIELWSSEKINPNNFAAYSIYLGNNNTTSFDLEAGSHYILRTDIDTKADNRVEESTVKQSIEFFCSSNGNDDGAPNAYYDLDAHYDQRRIIVTSLANNVIIELFEEGGIPAGINSWLKISRFSNYTDAYGTLSTKEKVKVVVPGKTSFFLYSDEYVIPNAPKRRMYVKITTESYDGLNKLEKEYYIEQQSIIQVGNWGGNFDSAKGKYEKNLGIEHIEEYAIPYQQGIILTANNRIVFGFNNVKAYNLGYDVQNAYNGRRATKDMAENKENAIVNNNRPLLEQPLKDQKNRVLLYQYEDLLYHNQAKYTNYAARYCYDKNRDLNGDGEINYDTELKWYLPAQNQLMALWVIRNSNHQSPFLTDPTYWSTMEDSETSSYPTRFSNGMTVNLTKIGTDRARCVRDID